MDCLAISETKLDESFPNAQFKLYGYEIRARSDRYKYGGGLIEFIMQGLIHKRLNKYKPKCRESICSEFKISQKKFGSVLVYIGLHQREILKHILKK